MKPLELKCRSLVRRFVAAAIYWIGLLWPAAGFAQPGRPFTPPPSPPPMPNPAVSLQQNHLQGLSMQSQISETQRTNKIHNDAVATINRAANPNAPRDLLGRNRGTLPNVMISVTKVEANSQCDRLGLMKGDVVVSYDGKAIKSIEHLRDLTKQNPDQNRKRMLVVIRDGETMRFEVLPGSLGLSMVMKRNGVG